LPQATWGKREVEFCARAEWLITSFVLSLIGVLLIVLAPGKQTMASAAAA
jgi:hypothetical protein